MKKKNLALALKEFFQSGPGQGAGAGAVKQYPVEVQVAPCTRNSFWVIFRIYPEVPCIEMASFDQVDITERTISQYMTGYAGSRDYVGNL